MAGLPDEVREALRLYTTEAYKRINGQLRRQQTSATVNELVQRIDTALAAYPLTGATLLARVNDYRQAFGVRSFAELEKIQGTPRVDDGYLSTSRWPHQRATGQKYQNSILLTVVAPPDTPAAVLEQISQFPEQGEILLGRGLRYLLQQVHYDGQGQLRATMLIMKR